MKNLITVLTLAGLLGLALYVAIYVWGALEGADISTHGWIAMGAGALVTFGLGAGLMFLVFYSNRRGYDEQVNSPDQDKD